MLVRIVLFLGVALILFAGGAAGWQYWSQTQSAPQVATGDDGGAAGSAAAPPAGPGPLAGMAGAAPPAVAPPAQNWLISPGGGVVSPKDAAPFLMQDRFVEGRIVSLSLRFPLSDLLSEGESLPGEPYVEAFAAIRAPVLALDLCRPLLDAWASGCRVAEAKLTKDSHDPATGTARFYFQLEYTQKPAPAPLPDLLTRIYDQDHGSLSRLGVSLDQTSTNSALKDLVKVAGDLCAVMESAGKPCAITRLGLDWEDPEEVRGSIEYGWLDQMPQGMYPAPPLY